MDDLLTVSGTPHIKSKDTVQSIMRDVCIALIPTSIMGVYFFGLNSLFIIFLSIASCVLAEALYMKLTKQNQTIGDLSAVVTGLLLALNLPGTAPFWLPIVGGFFAIIIIKQLFGGLGQNFINPALGARAFLLLAYPDQMTKWFPDAVTSATPLAALKNGNFVPISGDYINAFIGNIGGCIGEVSKIALLLGVIYLFVRKIINWRIPTFFIGTFVVFTFIFGRQGFFAGLPVYEAITGGLLLGAFFMATDYSTSPVTPKGQIIMGIGCGLISAVIRVYGGYPEGVSFAILIMNLTVPLIERYTKPRVFGEVSK